MENNLTLRESVLLASGFTLLILSIKLAESLLSVSLHQLGVYPQTPKGLIGIITGPLVHGSWQHVLGNSPPTILLGSMLIYGYQKSRWWVLTIVWLVSGLGVWFFARSNYHIGVSGLTHGIFFYLFVVGILRRDKRSVGLLMVAFFMYGTMVWTIFPYESGISFEYHLFGALSGAVCAIVFRHWDPKPERKTYLWENETGEEYLYEDDPLIGDEWKVHSVSVEMTSEPKDTGDKGLSQQR